MEAQLDEMTVKGSAFQRFKIKMAYCNGST